VVLLRLVDVLGTSLADLFADSPNTSTEYSNVSTADLKELVEVDERLRDVVERLRSAVAYGGEQTANQRL
jgi:hypothetical protein